ncbi:uncharacterized protein A4U43_C08F25720 [Asparagus officinalis]|nr:uncharacterized protein A4U43_C08F25720 [Asparagus officinalis]
MGVAMISGGRGEAGGGGGGGGSGSRILKRWRRRRQRRRWWVEARVREAVEAVAEEAEEELHSEERKNSVPLSLSVIKGVLIQHLAQVSVA